MQRNLRLMSVILLLLVGSTLSYAQQPTPAASAPQAAEQANEQMTPAGGDSGAEPFAFKRILTRFEFWLSLLILLFGVVVVSVQFALLRKKAFDGNDILKVFGVTLIIVGTLFLIAAGFGDKQIAPAMGLFGTLAGYLLGKASVESEKTDTKASDHQEAK